MSRREYADFASSMFAPIAGSCTQHLVGEVRAAGLVGRTELAVKLQDRRGEVESFDCGTIRALAWSWHAATVQWQMPDGEPCARSFDF